MPSGLKAGLIGAGVGIVFGLLSLIPAIGCCFNLAMFLVYVLAGVLAALWIPPIRSAGAGAAQGAIAGLITGIGSSVVGVIRALIFAVKGGMPIDPTTMEQLEKSGIEIDPAVWEFTTGTGGAVLSGVICCVGGLAMGVILGAIGGAIFASVKKD